MAEIWAIGLMSGTSMDGIDAALLKTDGERVAGHGAVLGDPYPAALRQRLRGILGEPGGPGGEAAIAAVEAEITKAHAALVRRLLDRAGLAPADIGVIGFHGHTIAHRPEQHYTRQIGDGGLLARLCGVPVVNDFRRADVVAGGQGAPLVPLYHRALARDLPRPLAVLNVGGVANITWIGADDSLLAFDTGPGNAPIDDWMLRHTGQAYDAGGALAATGLVAEVAVARALAQPYFARRPPKSLDRDDFSAAIAAGLAPADGAATLTAVTAAAAAAAWRHLPAPPRQVLVTGGGRHNATLMRMLAERLGVAVAPAAPAVLVVPVESVGWRGDALEAEAFAYLAVRACRGLALTLPSTTGAPHPLTGGRLWPAPGRE